jgi:hypothetical protein
MGEETVSQIMPHHLEQIKQCRKTFAPRRRAADLEIPRLTLESRKTSMPRRKRLTMGWRMLTLGTVSCIFLGRGASVVGDQRAFEQKEADRVGRGEPARVISRVERGRGK